VPNHLGWLGREAGGSEWASSLLLHNMISSPTVMRRELGLLRAAERRGRRDAVDVLLCEDRGSARCRLRIQKTLMYVVPPLASNHSRTISSGSLTVLVS
jgi:hypothetical protein